MSLHELIAKDGFRLRGHAMSRLDGFSDVVFGFALTLIVVSLEVPKTYHELHEVMVGILPFFICFVLFFTVWWSHFRFFRRYGLHDNGTVVINAGLLFTVLMYVYPLKFLFTMLVGELTHREGADRVFDNMYQVRELMVFYGAGFATIYVLLSALYWNALRQKADLELSPLEQSLTRTYIWDNLGVASVGVLCCILTYVLPVRIAGAAGYSFMLVGLWKTIHGFSTGAYLRRRHPGYSQTR